MKSLEEKIREMNGLGITLAVAADRDIVTFKENENNIIYPVADGLIEAHVMKFIECRVSLTALVNTKIEDLENKVDFYIKELKKIAEKYNINVNSSLNSLPERRVGADFT